jgi:hypothetical protein
MGKSIETHVSSTYSIIDLQKRKAKDERVIPF